MSSTGLKAVRLHWIWCRTENLRQRGAAVAMASDVNRAARWRAWKSTTSIFAASAAKIPS